MVSLFLVQKHGSFIYFPFVVPQHPTRILSPVMFQGDPWMNHDHQDLINALTSFIFVALQRNINQKISGSESFTRWLVARQGRDNLRSPPPWGGMGWGDPDRGRDRMVVGTLNLGSEMGLQFKVPTTMRRHGVREAQTWSETGARQSSCSLSCSLCRPCPIWWWGPYIVAFCGVL